MAVTAACAWAALALATAPAWPRGLPAAAVEAGRAHLAAASLVALAVLALARVKQRANPDLHRRAFARRGLGLAAAAGAVATGLHFAALPAVPAAPPVPDAPAWRLLHANLGEEPDLSALAGWLNARPADERPDGFAFQELRPGQPAAIDAALPGYAAAWSLPRPDSRGGGLWVREDVRAEALRVLGVPSEALAASLGFELHPEAAGARPLADLRLEDGRRTPVRLILFSAARPSRAARHAARDAELLRLAAASPPDGVIRPTVWLGDFNAPPWSPALKAAAERGGMRLASGTFRTWPDGPLRRLGVAIDLCLVSPGLSASVAPGPAIDSDHRPVLVTLSPTSAPAVRDSPER